MKARLFATLGAVLGMALLSVFAQSDTGATVLRTLAPTDVMAISVAPNSNTAFTVTAPSKVRSFDMASGREGEAYDLACESGSITKFKAGTQYLVGLCTGARNSVVRVNRASKVRESLRLESAPLDVFSNSSGAITFLIAEDSAFNSLNRWTGKALEPLSNLQQELAGILISGATIDGVSLTVVTDRNICNATTTSSTATCQSSFWPSDTAIKLSASGRTFMLFSLFSVFVGSTDGSYLGQAFDLLTNQVAASVAADDDSVIVQYRDGTASRYSITDKKAVGIGAIPALELGSSGRYALGFDRTGSRAVVSGNPNYPVFAPQLANRATLLVNTNVPGVTVSINGSPPESTDGAFEASLEAGTYTIVVAAPGYRTVQRSVTLRERQALSLNVPLERQRGSIRFDTVPQGAVVTLDGKQVGVTPFIATDIALGQHDYTLRLEDYREVSGSVLLEDELIKSVVGTPIEIPGLTFSSTPAGATVLIAGRTAGVTPLTQRNLEPGRVDFTMKFSGYQDFSGRAIVPQEGKGTVEVTLTKVGTTALNLTPRPEGAALRLVSAAAPNARKSLTMFDRKPALPLEELAALTGLGVYGDASTVQLVSGTQTLKLTVGEPQGKNARVFAYQNRLYLPLSELKAFGFIVSTASNGLVRVTSAEDSFDLGVPTNRVFSEALLAPVHQLWTQAFQRSIVLDGVPALPAAALPGVSGKRFKVQDGKLFDTTSGRALATIFKPVAGYRSTLVTVNDAAYLPLELLPLIGNRGAYRQGVLELTIGDLPVRVNVTTAGRVATTTTAARTSYNTLLARQAAEAKAAQAQRAREQAQQQRDEARAAADARVEERRFAEVSAEVERRTENLTYFGNDSQGRDIWGYYDVIDGYFGVAMLYAPTKNRDTWQYCLLPTTIPAIVLDSATGSGGIRVVLQSQGVTARFLITFVKGRCGIRAY